MFSQNFIFAGWGHFKELQLKSDLSDFSQVWSVERLTYLQQMRVGEFDNSKNYFVETFLCAVTMCNFENVL